MADNKSKTEPFPEDLDKAIAEGLPPMEDDALTKRAETIVKGYN